MKICRTEKQSEYMYIQFQVPTLSMIIKYFFTCAHEAIDRTNDIWEQMGNIIRSKC